MSVTLYHNPACGTSRSVLEILKEVGEEPKIIEYLKEPPTKAELTALIRRMKVPVRDMMRKTGSPYVEMDLDNLKFTDEQLIEAMAAHPMLINRPIVATPKGAKLCRPADEVRTLL